MYAFAYFQNQGAMFINLKKNRAHSVPENQRVFLLAKSDLLTRTPYLRRFSLSVTDSNV